MTTVKSHNAHPKVVLGEKPYLSPSAIVQNTQFGKYTEVQHFADISDSIIDDYSYVMENTQITNTSVGKFANIASNVRINPGFHPYDMPTQHHMVYRKQMYGFGEDDKAFFNYRNIQRVIIGHDVWIGHGAVIMPGVTVGNGAIIGANAVVTKDVPSYAIVAGVGAKVIKYRFAKKIIQALQTIQWWHWSHDEIKERFDDLKDIRTFIYKYLPKENYE